MSVDSLASAMAVHRRTVSRMLESMQQRGWVEVDPSNDRNHRLTAIVLNVAGAVLRGMDLVSIARPYVAALRDSVGETSHLAVPSDGWAVHVLEEPSRHTLAVSSALGSRVPLHATAVGKALAAYLPDQLKIATGRGLRPLSDRTIVSHDDLGRHLEQVRKNGFAIDDGEVTPDTRCAAAPVFDMTGMAVASIGFSGPSTRVTSSQLDKYAEVVRSTAQRLSSLLGQSSMSSDEGARY